MLLLFESAAGFALFKVLKEGKLKETEDVGADFATLDQAQKVCMHRPFLRVPIQAEPQFLFPISSVHVHALRVAYVLVVTHAA